MLTVSSVTLPAIATGFDWWLLRAEGQGRAQGKRNYEVGGCCRDETDQAPALM